MSNSIGTGFSQTATGSSGFTIKFEFKDIIFSFII